MDTNAMLDRLVPLFNAGGRFHGRFSLDPAHAPAELLDAHLWEVPVFPTGAASALLMRVYAFDSTLGEILHAHWRNETRALLRLSTRGNRALPRLLEAEFLGKSELGYLVLEDSGYALAGAPDAAERLRTDARAGFTAFFAIVEAVAAMHEEGLLHRNLSLEALRLAEGRDAIVVDGFQMSSFLSSWFRPRPSQQLRALAPSDPLSMWMLAPERVAAVRGDAARDVESYSTDVFSLGLIGIHLLVGALDTPPGTYSREAHRAWTDAQRAKIDRSNLPVVVRRALANTVAFDRGNRLPSAVRMQEMLSQAYGAILAALEWGSVENAPAFELLYLKESIDRIYEDGRSRSDPSSPDFAEYNQIISEDLASGVLTWSPDGFEPWERHDRVNARRAKIVLLGRAYSYFCQYLDAGRPTEDRARIVVKHMMPMDRSQELKRSPRVRSAPRVVCGYFAPGARLAARPKGTGAWGDLIATVQHDGGRANRQPVIAAARWMIDAQHAELRRSWYQVERVEEHGDLIHLRSIPTPSVAPDDREGAFDRLWELGAERKRMGPAFESLAHDAAEADEPLRFVLRGRREDREPIAWLRFDRVLDPDTCALRVLEARASIPRTAWLMPDDGGTRAQLRRQADAVLDIEQRYGHLAAQLRAPRSIRIPSELRRSEDDGGNATETLLRTIHETWPLFALQGPPGTGKTHVAAELIKRIVADDPYARILVTAQSHHALDNLLEGVVARLPNVAVLRIASEGTTNKLSALALDYRLPARLDRLVEQLGNADRKTAPAAARPIADELRKRARNKELELRADLARRLPGSSTIVFTTAAQATPEHIGGTRGAGSFDWVVVEEAARGWITEFLVPMVHGARWLLVGDHAQLPAHRARVYHQALRRDIDEKVTGPVTGIEPTPDWMDTLGHFAHLMKAPPAGRDQFRGRLAEQRRMHPEIASLIRAAFYPEGLDSHAEATRPHPINVRPFAGTALVWLDTSGLGPEAYERNDGALSNQVELNVLKVLFCNAVGNVRALDKKVPPLAVLAPYRGQARKLREQLGVGEEVVQTVDSFQGRQAEVVLVSLVRNNASPPETAIGFLSEPPRVNVMFSRARRLLVVAGSLSHFARAGTGTFWEAVAAYFRSDSRFLVDVRDLGFTARGPRGRT